MSEKALVHLKENYKASLNINTLAKDLVEKVEYTDEILDNDLSLWTNLVVFQEHFYLDEHGHFSEEGITEFKRLWKTYVIDNPTAFNLLSEEQRENLLDNFNNCELDKGCRISDYILEDASILRNHALLKSILKGFYSEKTKIEYSKEPKKNTQGKLEATLLITFVDGSTKEIKVSNNEENETVDTHTITLKPHLELEENQPIKILNELILEDLPEGTEVNWKAGKEIASPRVGSTGTLVIIFPDKTEIELNITLTKDHFKKPTTTSTNKPTSKNLDKDKYIPVAYEDKSLSEEEFKKMTAKDWVINHNFLPKDTDYTFVDIEVDDKGSKVNGYILVTYPDKSTEKVKFSANFNKGVSISKERLEQLTKELRKLSIRRSLSYLKPLRKPIKEMPKTNTDLFLR